MPSLNVDEDLIYYDGRTEKRVLKDCKMQGNVVQGKLV